ncbi:MAG: hypothetical protein L3J96_07090 [Thermoplasmata archaeon]|nr:hypothetical protein [Thermoplasmata archaeon]
MESHHSASSGSAPETVSIPFLLAAALLIGGGLFAIATWFVTGQWIWFVGILPVVLGGFMLFSPRTGPDRHP